MLVPDMMNVIPRVQRPLLAIVLGACSILLLTAAFLASFKVFLITKYSSPVPSANATAPWICYYLLACALQDFTETLALQFFSVAFVKLVMRDISLLAALAVTGILIWNGLFLS